MSKKSSNNAKKGSSLQQPVKQQIVHDEPQDSVEATAQEGAPAVNNQPSSLLSGQDPSIDYRARSMAVGAIAGSALLILTAITGVFDFSSVFGF